MRDPLLITDLDKKCKVYKYTDLQNRGKEEMTTNLSNLEVILTEENFNSSSYGKKKHFKTPLESLLTSSPEGKVILSVWKTEKKFTDVHRQKLGDEIIREELRSNINKKLTDERIDFWTQSILDLFPGEIKEVWNGTSEKCRNQSAGRGMLLQRYYSMRRKLLKSGVISKSTEKSASLNPTEVTESRETKDAIEYLKNTTRSVSQIIDIWQTTSNVRFTYLKKNEITAQDYMDQFKALKLIDGHKLLEADFENIYPDSTSNLFNEWPFLCRFVMSKVTSVERESVDKCITTDGKKAKIIRLMHSLFNVKTIFCKNKKHWRPSRTEARDGLLQYVKAEDDAVKIINEKRKNFTDLGISHGPQVLAISNNQDTIECSYVIINQVWYPIENPLKALDVAFKAAHMLNIPYPMECQREMLFLQLAIYGIKVDNIKKIDVKTTSLIAEYRNFKSDNND